MASSTYDVIARFRVDAAGATRSLSGLQASLRTIQGSLGGTQSAFGGMFRSMVGIGAGYLGFQAISGAIRMATSDAIQFQSELEGTRIGIQSILGAVEGTGFAGAADQASDAWNRLSLDALRSTATTQQLFQIFGGMVGPMRNAGTEMERIYGITNNTVAAANALGVDFNQANRDIGAMVRGTAGVDVKLFSMLRSTGAITQNTEEFNALLAPERINVLEAALSQFADASAAYGMSFAGLSSSLADFYQHFRSSFTGPIFDAIKTIMKSILDVLIVTEGTETKLSDLTNNIDNRLGLFGEHMAASLLRGFDAIKRTVVFVAANWDSIVAKIQMVASVLKAAFIGAAATSLAKALAGGIVGGLSRVVGLMATMAEIRMGLTAASVASAAGTAGLGGTVAVAGLGPLGAAVAMITPVLPVLAAAAAAIALVGVAIGGVVLLFKTNSDEMLAVAQPIIRNMGDVWVSVKAIGDALWKVFRPILRIIGALVVGTLSPAFAALSGLLRIVAIGLEHWMTVIADWAVKFEENVVDPMVSFILRISSLITQYFSFVPDLFRQIREQTGEAISVSGEAATAPAERARTVNDFRGSRISIEQTFKEADPDRVMVRMMNDLNRAAEQRIQSGYAPALTRS